MAACASVSFKAEERGLRWLLATDVLTLSGRKRATSWKQRNPTREKKQKWCNRSNNETVKIWETTENVVSCLPQAYKLSSMLLLASGLILLGLDLIDFFPNDVKHTGPDLFWHPTSLSVSQHFTGSRILTVITTAPVMAISCRNVKFW